MSSGVEGAVFCMIEYKISDIKAFCQTCRIKNGAVAFLVWQEAVAVFIKAKRLAHQPVGTLGILSAHRIVRLVTETT